MTRSNETVTSPYSSDPEENRSVGRTVLGVILIVVGLISLFYCLPSASLDQPATAGLAEKQSATISDGATFTDPTSGKQFRHVKRPISEIYPGMRATAEAPTDDIDLAFGSQVDPSSWKLVTLKAPKKKGSYSDVWLLRPETWIEASGAIAGESIYLSLPEMGIETDAEVVRIDPCPEILDGPGQVVTGRFVHHDAELIDLKIASEPASIGTTPNHPFWSEDRQEFARADSLSVGEKVRTLNGFSTVESLTKREGLHTVYNLEIQVNHVYHVGEGGVLVHNTCPGDFVSTDIFEASARQYAASRSAASSSGSLPRGIRSYVRDLELQTGRRLHSSQIGHLKENLRSQRFSKLSNATRFVPSRI